eukprot:IDg12405t1
MLQFSLLLLLQLCNCTALCQHRTKCRLTVSPLHISVQSGGGRKCDSRYKRSSPNRDSHA